jgi:hypothetical protein
MQFPSYEETVNGKTLTSENHVFFSDGEELASRPLPSSPPNFDAVDLSPVSSDEATAQIRAAGEKALATGLYPRSLRVGLVGLPADEVKKCILAGVASPYRQLVVAATPEQLAQQDDELLRHVTFFEFDDCFRSEYFNANPHLNKCRITARPQYEQLPDAVDKLLSLRASGVRTVDVLPPADLNGPPLLDYWLRLAAMVVHRLYEGDLLNLRCFEGLMGPVTNMYYRLAAATGDQLWSRYANSPQQFAAAFWAYSELHLNIPIIDRERRRI